MSTICKLYPKVREARAERASFLKFLRGAVVGPDPDFRALCIVPLERLERLKRRSDLNVRDKSFRFASILRQYAEGRHALENKRNGIVASQISQDREASSVEGSGGAAPDDSVHA